MKKEIIKALTNTFESHSYTTENGIEFWYARDLQHLLGYTKWDNFVKVINKAKINKGSRIYEHGISIGRTSDLMGISQWELMSYVGKTNIEDIGETQKVTSVRKRIAIAKQLFGAK